MIRRPPRSAHFPCTTLFRSYALQDLATDPCFTLSIVSSFHMQHGYVTLLQAHPKSLTPRVENSPVDRKSTRLNSSHANISYAVFCLKKNHHRRPSLDPPASH